MWGSSLRKRQRGFDHPPKGPAGKRCYAIGDVHGRLDLLTGLLEKIDADIKKRPTKETVLVFLGDLIDRGPDSRGVIELLMQGSPVQAALYLLKGNHEDMFLQGMGGDVTVLPPWLEYGGYAFARSYGVEVGSLFGRTGAEIQRILAEAVPRAHLAFMDGFLDSIQFGDFLLVHAGVRPGVPIDKQSPRDLRWIRDEFLNSDFNPGCVVVHGHSMADDVEIKNNRICIDTGAYRSGTLTAIAIEEEEIYFLKASGPKGEPDLFAQDADQTVQ